LKIGIICAMEEELTSILQHLNLTCQINQEYGLVLQKAQYLQHELAFILSGIGKVNAAIHSQFMINQFNPDYVINVGVAGSLSPDLTFGDVVIANDLIQHDIDVAAFGIPLGQIPRMDVFAFSASEVLLQHAQTITGEGHKVVIGRIATGDQFIAYKDKAEFIHNNFQALACEMEGAAIAHTCYLNKVPFIVVRALSDMAGREDVAIRSFNELKQMTAARSSFIVKKLLGLI
jgi:adenosylhomocysteine nucleosidase